ncbi:MAG: DUF4388 domain-containing protein [Chloroflexales bacterium]|nr:DUF4388 domain-containing protein [Chloroflexales bacterium]
MGLEGKLTDMPMLDLLRVFQRSARSGKLMLWNEVEWALIWLLEGQVVSAVVLHKPAMRPQHAGEEAIFQLFTWADGHFRYNPDSVRGSYPITIRRSTSDLIIEALQRRRAEARPPAPGELTLQTPLCILPQMAGTNEYIRLSVEEWMVLTRIGQQATAQQVAAQTRLPQAKVLMIVDHLIACGLIMCVPLADLPQRQLTVEPPRSAASHAEGNAPITNLTRAIRRRLQQLAVGA